MVNGDDMCTGRIRTHYLRDGRNWDCVSMICPIGYESRICRYEYGNASCVPCPPETYKKETTCSHDGSNAFMCIPWTKCTYSTIESVKPTATNDRICVCDISIGCTGSTGACSCKPIIHTTSTLENITIYINNTDSYDDDSGVTSRYHDAIIYGVIVAAIVSLSLAAIIFIIYYHLHKKHRIYNNSLDADIIVGSNIYIGDPTVSENRCLNTTPPDMYSVDDDDDIYDKIAE
jgi:hypothetical protein